MDMIAKQFSNGVVQTDTKLTYWEQSGTLMNSMALVFAILAKQYALKQTAAQADWLVGEGIFTSGVKGRALFSFAAPGTAYNDPKLGGKDPQPAHMKRFVETTDDNGGIHTNSGIPNHAFYQVAIALGGFAWEKAGRIWYDAMRDKRLKADARFSDFARITLQHAKKLFGLRSVEATAVKEGWAKVGVKIGR
jgi:Zn-dependent metalloprotease